MFSNHFPEFQKLPVTSWNCRCQRFGVFLDENLNMTRHINDIVKMAFLKLRELSYYRRYLSKESLNTVLIVHAYVTPRIDYCNSLREASQT